MGLNTVVGRNHKNGDVRNLGTTGTHDGESFVTWGVDESEGAAILDDLVSTDVLSNTAGFGVDDASLADGVEQEGLTMVDVTHDDNDWGACHQGICRFAVHDVGQAVNLNVGSASVGFLVHFFRNETEVFRDDAGGVEVDTLV